MNLFVLLVWQTEQVAFPNKLTAQMQPLSCTSSTGSVCHRGHIHVVRFQVVQLQRADAYVHSGYKVPLREVPGDVAQGNIIYISLPDAMTFSYYKRELKSNFGHGARFLVQI